MGESVKYIHHCIGSTTDRDRLPGVTGPCVAGNLRVVPTAGERTGQAVSGGHVLADHGQAYKSNRFRGVQLPTVVEELSTRPRIPLAIRGELHDEMVSRGHRVRGRTPYGGHRPRFSPLTDALAGEHPGVGWADDTEQCGATATVVIARTRNSPAATLGR